MDQSEILKELGLIWKDVANEFLVKEATFLILGGYPKIVADDGSITRGDYISSRYVYHAYKLYGNLPIREQNSIFHDGKVFDLEYERKQAESHFTLCVQHSPADYTAAGNKIRELCLNGLEKNNLTREDLIV